MTLRKRIITLSLVVDISDEVTNEELEKMLSESEYLRLKTKDNEYLDLKVGAVAAVNNLLSAVTIDEFEEAKKFILAADLKRSENRRLVAMEWWN
ncbi:MAG: hypothetical protein HGA35_06710, partial [Erysipelotrichaceae bacterium]|nr:hypothetical protein [Erysipelotrichaceae bacterium]